MVENNRSVDDFLSELYVYKKQTYYEETSPQQTSCKRKRRYLRHYEIPLPLLALCIANSSDATEILMISYLLADQRFRADMFSEDSSMEGAKYLASSIFAGMLIGGTVLGFLSDKIGRRPALLLGLVTNSVAGLSSSLPIFSSSIVQLSIWRFIAGVGIGATVPPLFTLASEWSPKEVRGVFVTGVASFWMIGSILVSLVAWFLFQLELGDDLPIWRVFAATCALPSFFGAWTVYKYVPESPRFFLTAENRDCERAAKACNQMAMLLNIPITAGDHEKRSELFGSATTSREVHFLTEDELFVHYQNHDAKNFGTSETVNPTIASSVGIMLQQLRKLYSSQLLPRTTLPLQLLWLCLSFTTYGITTWINTLFVSIRLENIYFNSFLFALASLPGNVVSLVYSDRCDRKKMLIGSLMGAACGLGVFATTVYADDLGEQPSSSQTFLIVLCACAFQAFNTISWNAIDIITAENFPTSIRSAGTGVCTATGRLGGILSQSVNAALIVDDTGEGAAWILAVASIALLVGAGTSLILDRDMRMEELKDDTIYASSRKQNEHPIGETTDVPHLQLQSSSRGSEYQTYQEDVESNQPFLISGGIT